VRFDCRAKREDCAVEKSNPILHPSVDKTDAFHMAPVVTTIMPLELASATNEVASQALAGRGTTP